MATQAHWTDSWLALIVVVVLAWQVFPTELVEKLTQDRSSPVIKYLKETGKLCDYEPSKRIEYQSTETFILKNARIIDGNGSYTGIWNIHVKNGKFEKFKKSLKSKELVLYGNKKDDDGGVYGRYITPGLIDPFGVEQDGVTTRIVHNGYGSAYKNDRLLIPKNWVRLDDYDLNLHLAKRLWVRQELWCEKLKNDIKSLTDPIPEEEGMQPYVDYFRGLKAINNTSDYIGGEDLLFQAQLKFHHGESSENSLASITGTMADNLGIDKIGYIRRGYDADFVVWDRHPLQLGAVPEEVYIDGEPQMKLPISQNVVVQEHLPIRHLQHIMKPIELKDFVITGIIESHVAYPAGKISRPQDRFQLVVRNKKAVCFSTDCRRHFGNLYRLDVENGYIMPQFAEFFSNNKTVVYGDTREFTTHAPIIETDDIKVINKLIENKRLYGSDFVILGGGKNAHYAAHELATEEIPVILTSLDAKVGYQSNLNILFSAGVKLGISAHPLRFKAGLASELSGIPRNDVLDMISTNIFNILDIDIPNDGLDFVVSEGFGLDIGSVIAASVEDGILKMSL